jgi:hypothetical protein
VCVLWRNAPLLKTTSSRFASAESASQAGAASG